jgi:hypothetical protein
MNLKLTKKEFKLICYWFNCYESCMQGDDDKNGRKQDTEMSKLTDKLNNLNNPSKN